jgi:hypothetical protein
MNGLLETSIYCPYCGESLDILVDETDANQEYIEDCQVCCRPMVIRLSIAPDGAFHIEARHEDDA